MEKIYAMPSICDTTDFGLSNESLNKAQAVKWLARSPTTLGTIGSSCLYRVGDNNNGFIFLYNTKSQLVTYFVRYKTRLTKIEGHTVTQTALWRALGAFDTADITRNTIFKYFLVHYPAIMSDRIQTEDGRRFWTDLMGKALSQGFQVCLVDLNSKTIHSIDSEDELRAWVSDEKSMWAWNSMKHQGLRFMIRKESK